MQRIASDRTRLGLGLAVLFTAALLLAVHAVSVVYRSREETRRVVYISTPDRDFIARGVNDAGVVVGYSTMHKGRNPQLAGFIFNHGQRVDYPH